MRGVAMPTPMLLALALGGCAPTPGAPEPAVELAELLADDAARGFEGVRADGPPLAFPGDHDAHPGHRVEWWYLTARLADGEGRRHGLQFTLFRLATRPGGEPARGWTAPQVYLRHAALAELDGEAFVVDERRARPVAGRVGDGTSEGFRLDDCGLLPRTRDALFPARLDCRFDGADVSLELEDRFGRALHGDGGFSRKSAAGGASRYYSHPRVAATGTLRYPGDAAPRAVRGSAWFDHEWTSAVLGEGERGWDWLSLRLSDGGALMLFRIRGEEGPRSLRGSRIAADGSVDAFTESDAPTWTATRWWTSPASGVRYPVGWTLRDGDLSLDISAVRADQELLTDVRYWEGAVDAAGSRDGAAVTGEGFLELTGYR